MYNYLYCVFCFFLAGGKGGGGGGYVWIMKKWTLL